jgi:hypothetical protein
VASHHETSHDVVRALERHFWSLVSGVVPSPGRHFAAIAHPATPLVTHACNTGYRHVFINPPDIGERYATLSLFGLVPAVLAGVSGTALLDSARAMADACRPDRPSNPGLVLGAFIGGHAWAGRDKLTVLAAEPLAPLAAWVEQIVAESTGQEGRGVLPIVDEPVGSIGEYGEDRAFVVLLTPEDGELARTASALEAAGLPVFRLVTTPAELGGELFRWQFATAVASAVLGVNPFDEADAVDADGHTNAQLEARRTTGAFRTDPPFDRGPGYRRREFRPAEAAPPRERSYLAVLDYLPRDRRRTAVIRRLRAALRLRSGLATTHGVGPCYLHSTGRYHKGGPNTGAFLILTAADQSATPVPGTKYTFSMLTQAQACGDFDALAAAGRPVIHYHIEDPTGDVASDLERVTRELA